MDSPAGLNDVEEVTMKALAAFSRKGQDVPLERASVGYPYLVDTLVSKGYVVLNGALCTLTAIGRVELARLAAI
jgi:hypothetical protein